MDGDTSGAGNSTFSTLRSPDAVAQSEHLKEAPPMSTQYRESLGPQMTQRTMQKLLRTPPGICDSKCLQLGETRRVDVAEES